MHRSDAIVVLGFIVDDLTGKPLENVIIHTVDNAAKTETNSIGFFQLFIPLPTLKDNINERNALIFEMNTYKTEIRENFDMWPSGDCIIQIRLKTGVGINKENIIKNRQPSITLID